MLIYDYCLQLLESRVASSVGGGCPSDTIPRLFGHSSSMLPPEENCGSQRVFFLFQTHTKPQALEETQTNDCRLELTPHWVFTTC
jgi:hypothetical protein